MRDKLLLIILMFGLGACGDMFTKEEDDKNDSLDQFATCEIDTEAFSYILEKNISGEIRCLKKNLDIFIDTVKTDRPGYVSKKVLKEFIEFGPIEIDQDVLGLVDSVFDLSHVILGTDKNYIKQEDMNVLIDFLEYFNEHIWKSYKFFMSEDPVNYSRHLKEREIVYNEFRLIANKLESIFVAKRDDIDRINTEELVFNFFKSDTGILEKVRSMFFLKRAFLGGNVWDLTHTEVARTLEIFPKVAQVAFDMVKVEHYEFKNEQQTLINIFQNDLDVLEEVLYFDIDSHEAVFTVYDLINVITTVAPDLLPIDISKYPKELMKLKQVFLGSSQEIVSARELIEAFAHGRKILDEADLFYRVYDFYKDELDSRMPISHNFEDFPVNNSRDKEYLDNFVRIVHEYKFLKGSLTSAYYTFDYYRNANAFFQIGALEYAIKVAMGYYGSKNPDARGGYDMTLDETVTLIDDFKWFLKDQGIITIGRVGGGEVEGIADNFVLMSTLFQYQSDGCDTDYACMEIPEITEFVLGLLTAVEVKDFFTDTMMDFCATELDEFNRIEPSCFRRNFVRVLEEEIPGEGRAIKDYMPYLYEYLQGFLRDLPDDTPATESRDFMKFITETEAFTRTCMFYDDEQTDEVWLKGKDAFAVFAGLLNVESTLLRFDQDQNNNVDAKNSKGKNEVLNAYYSTYKGAVTALVEDIVGSELIAKLIAKPIFQYLVKYGEVPNTDQFSSIWKFVRFILKKSKNKNADISRTTVSTILKVIGEQSENADLHPFKCEECLRDPTIECVPEGDGWQY